VPQVPVTPDAVWLLYTFAAEDEGLMNNIGAGCPSR
jgi:hypothetical protein